MICHLHQRTRSRKPIESPLEERACKRLNKNTKIRCNLPRLHPSNHIDIPHPICFRFILKDQQIHQRIYRKIYQNIYLKKQSQHRKKESYIKKHIKTPIFGFQPLSLGCGPLSLGRGPQDSKHKSEPTFSPKNQTPKFAIIFFAQCALTVRSSILSQNSKSYHAIPDKDSLPKMFDHE